MKHKSSDTLKLYAAIFFSCTVAFGVGFLLWQDAYTARLELDEKVSKMRTEIAQTKACSDLEEGTLIGFEVVSFEQDKVRIDQQEPMQLSDGSFANCAPFVMVTIDGSPPLAQPGAGCVLHLYREAEIFVARYPFHGQNPHCIAGIKMDDDGSHGVIAINAAAFSVKMVP